LWGKRREIEEKDLPSLVLRMGSQGEERLLLEDVEVSLFLNLSLLLIENGIKCTCF